MTWIAVALGHEPGEGPSLWPAHQVDADARRGWTAADGFRHAPASAGPGSRVAATLQVEDDGPAVVVEARGASGGRRGPWRPLEETFRNAEHRVMVADLDAAWDAVELRVADADSERIGALGWELLEPRFPDAGRISRERSLPPLLWASSALDPALVRIGVQPRSVWGARASGCTTPEDDWYRMAIHHTAGPQTSGGTVAGAVAATQAYAMDSGGYCDIAYQFMVGYDGSLWEGRELRLYSGATGGGNNDGNAAACLVGCYHPEPDCATAHDANDEIVGGVHLLVQTFRRLWDIPSSHDDIRGHREWPGNATACPGDYTIARFDEILADATWFAGVEVARAGDTLALAPGETAEVTVTFANTGLLPWEPGEVKLGVTGDAPAPFADPGWESDHRAATVDATALPGEEATFRFPVRAPDAPGVYSATFGLVAEGVTWFADPPWGGGPADDAITVTVEVVAETEPTDPEPTDTGTPSDTGALPPPPYLPPARVAVDPKGCGCAPGGPAPRGLSAAGWAAALGGALLRRRRRG